MLDGGLARKRTFTAGPGGVGASAYQDWLAQPGNAGKSKAEFFAAMKGADGKIQSFLRPDGVPVSKAQLTLDDIGASTSTVALSAAGAVPRTRDDFLGEQPATPAAFGAVGDGVANDTLAFIRLFSTPGIKLVPRGVYLVDALTISTPFLKIILAEGAIILLRTVPDFGDGTNYYAADHAVLHFTAAAIGSSLTGRGTVSGNRSVTASKWLAYPHLPTYGNGSYVIDVKAFGVWSDAPDFTCEGITVRDCIGGGLFSYGAPGQTWRTIAVRNCTKVFNLQSLTASSVVEGVVGFGITNRLADGRVIPYWQHAFEMRDFRDSTFRNCFLASDFCPLVNDGSGNLIGDSTPCAYVGERMVNNDMDGLRVAPFVQDTSDGRTTALVIGLSLSGGYRNRIPGLVLRGYQVGVLLNSCSANRISDFDIDGLYASAPGADATGIVTGAGGIGQLSVAGGINPDYRLNAGSDRNLWINGRVTRFKIGVLIASPDNVFVNVSSDGNTFDGWQMNAGVANSSFPASPQQSARRARLFGCSGCRNGRAGIFATMFDMPQVIGGAYNDNGQDIHDPTAACGITTAGSGFMTGLVVQDADATDTQAYTQARNISFAPGATDAKNQISVTLMDRSRVGVGQYIRVKNGTGSADIVGKVIDIDQDVAKLQMAAPATFSSSGNTVALSGTISPTANPVILQGSGTAFLSQVPGAAYAVVGGVLVRISKVISDTQIQLAAAPPSAIAANASGSLILCDQAGIPSQQRGVHVTAFATGASIRLNNADGNLDRPIGWDSFASFVAGQELLYRGALTSVSTTGVDTGVLPTVPGTQGWVVAAYRFQITQAVTGTGGGQMTLVLGSDSSSVTIDPGISLTKNAGRGGAAPSFPQPASGIYPVARLTGHSSLPTGGQVRADLLIRKQGLPPFAAVA